MVAAARALGDLRMRLPREPYPGLRPFLDFEAPLLFGRERQVREIIERLAQTQFVAVLGGSGSGKSSLIHAGVTPELRSFGIRRAGDLWLPMVCTPGTNVDAATQAARTHTPITRLARRFAEQLLKPIEDPAASERRIAEIAEVFRQEAGFARLMEAYGDELDVPPGPDPKDARVLFVIDQFEEIFHPTNRSEPDAGTLVERVLDHFFAPHERCYVVITMRSEHLNDCASYLELPDAINKASYLVRRLDTDELREAIVGPAQRFLRLIARSDPENTSLPSQVVFADAVLARLLRDVKAISSDPDHLPLLQHMLARLWQAAREREDIDVLVPSTITSGDLVRAVHALRPGDLSPLEDHVNTLRDCVDNWPQQVYEWLDADKRAQIDAVFRRLAFKDPNTGLYSQQRVQVDEAAALLGPGRTAADLRDLLGEGYLGAVDYLHWDAEDPTRVTVKVSHESFIRGWKHFRRLIDLQAAQFAEYLGVVRRCADWAENGRHPDDLLKRGDLRRLRVNHFVDRLRRPGQQEAWGRLLALDRDAERLARHAPLCDAYYRRSRRRAALAPAVVLASVASGMLVMGLFTVFVQSPTVSRVDKLLDVHGQTNVTSVPTSFPDEREPALLLRRMMSAAISLDGARSGSGTPLGSVSARLIMAMSGLEVVNSQGQMVHGVAATTESLVNERLRDTLTSSIWTGAPLPRDTRPLREPVWESVACVDAATKSARTGWLLVSQSNAPSGGRPVRRALFVPQDEDEPGALSVYAASWNPGAPPRERCATTEKVLSVSPDENGVAVVDASLRYLAHARGAPQGQRQRVVLEEIEWNIGDAGDIVGAAASTITEIGGAALWGRLHALAQASGRRLNAAATWAVDGGSVLDVGGDGWRVVSTRARRIRIGPEDAQRFSEIAVATEGSVCQRLGRAAADPKARQQLLMLQAETLCLAVTRELQPIGAVYGTSQNYRTRLRVAVYARPNERRLAGLKVRPPVPLAQLSQFATLDAAARLESTRWAMGIAGPHRGWLAMTVSDEGERTWIGQPLTTCALWRLGVTVMPPDSAGPAAAPGASCAAL